MSKTLGKALLGKARLNFDWVEQFLEESETPEAVDSDRLSAAVREAVEVRKAERFVELGRTEELNASGRILARVLLQAPRRPQ